MPIALASYLVVRLLNWKRVMWGEVQWRFHVGFRGHRPPNLAQAPKLILEQLDTVVLLLVDVTGSIVISLSHCCLTNDEGPGPKIFFPRTAPVRRTGIPKRIGIIATPTGALTAAAMI